MPLVGYGTSRVLDEDRSGREHLEAYGAIRAAIESGYRFIDTAAYYRNEQLVGQAIRDCLEEKVLASREELIVCTKVWNTAHRRESVRRACKESLERLQLDYVDIYLIHWPMAYAENSDPILPLESGTNKRVQYADTHFTDTWRGMEDVKEAGWAKCIGLSNFNSKQIEQILQMAHLRHRPAVNQVECHPYLNQEKLLEFCNKRQIKLQAHCPLGSPASCAKPGQPKLLEDQLVAKLAGKYQKSPAQILIRFLVQRGVAALPKSLTASRIRENLEVDFQLEPEDLASLLSLDQKLRYCENADVDVRDHPLFPFNEEF